MAYTEYTKHKYLTSVHSMFRVDKQPGETYPLSFPHYCGSVEFLHWLAPYHSKRMQWQTTSATSVGKFGDILATSNQKSFLEFPVAKKTKNKIWAWVLLKFGIMSYKTSKYPANIGYLCVIWLHKKHAYRSFCRINIWSLLQSI